MNNIKINIKLLDNLLTLPKYETEGSAGLDLQASIKEPVVIQPGQRALIPTGIALHLPKNIEGQIRPRSGLALKFGITVLNSPGTIDSDYQGEIKIILINLGQEIFTVTRAMRIAQLVIATINKITWSQIQEFTNKTTREDAGFGSTGF